ncbi:MAG: hypothetical protein AAGI30_02730 [Planctomycetota bacterium]
MDRMTIVSFAALAGLAGGVAAQPFFISAGHTDILVGLENGELEIEIEVIPGDGFFEVSPAFPDGVIDPVEGAGAVEPDEVIYNITQDQFDSASGTWRFGEDFGLNEQFVGWGAEEVDTGVFENDTLTFELVSVSGPGNFRLFTIPDPFNPVEEVLLQNPGDQLDVFAASADHFTFEFDQRGTYEITVFGFGTLVGESSPIFSDNATITFFVPAPGAAGLLGLAGLAAARRRR